jgi:hypothetical protein
MPSRNSKTKLVVHRTSAPDPIGASECDIVELALARFVALAYVSDYPNHFANGNIGDSGESRPSPSAIPLVAEQLGAPEATQYEAIRELRTFDLPRFSLPKIIETLRLL